jgi:hypothetical protein
MTDTELAAAMMELPEFVKSRKQARNARAEGRTSSAAEAKADFESRYGRARQLSTEEVVRALGPSLLDDLSQADADLAAGQTQPMSEFIAEFHSPEELTAAEIIGLIDAEMLTALAMLAGEPDDLINEVFTRMMLFGSRMWLQAYSLAVEDENALLTVTKLGREVITLAHERIILRGTERLAARSQQSELMPGSTVVLKDAVKDLQRFARPDLGDEQLERAAQITADALEASDGGLLSEADRQKLRRDVRRNLAEG